MGVKLINPIEYSMLYGTHKSLIHKWLKKGKPLPMVNKVIRSGEKYWLEVPDDLTEKDLSYFRRKVKPRIKQKVVSETGEFFSWDNFKDLIL